MRSKGKVDDNQPDIVKRLRKIPGVTVQVLSEVGNGCPDIAVGFRERNFFIELKDGAKVPSAQKLTEMQQAWHLDWRGQVDTANSFDRVLEIIGAKRAA